MHEDPNPGKKEATKHNLRVFCLRRPLTVRCMKHQSWLYRSWDRPMFCFLTVAVLIMPGRSTIPHRVTRHFRDKLNVINRFWLIMNS